MAWEARLAAPISQVGDRIRVDVEFYDAAAPDTVLHLRRLEFQVDVARKQIREAIIKVGRDEQAARARANALNEAFAGATLAIPGPDEPIAAR